MTRLVAEDVLWSGKPVFLFPVAISEALTVAWLMVFAAPLPRIENIPGLKIPPWPFPWIVLALAVVYWMAKAVWLRRTTYRLTNEQVISLKAVTLTQNLFSQKTLALSPGRRKLPESALAKILEIRSGNPIPAKKYWRWRDLPYLLFLTFSLRGLHLLYTGRLQPHPGQFVQPEMAEGQMLAALFFLLAFRSFLALTLHPWNRHRSITYLLDDSPATSHQTDGRLEGTS